MKALLAGYRFPYAWNDAHPARVGLLPRTGGGDMIIWAPVDPCYVFHPANAFETADGKVIVNVVAHDTMFAESRRRPDIPPPRLGRRTIDPPAGASTHQTLRALGGDKRASAE